MRSGLRGINSGFTEFSGRTPDRDGQPFSPEQVCLGSWVIRISAAVACLHGFFFFWFFVLSGRALSVMYSYLRCPVQLCTGDLEYLFQADLILLGRVDEPLASDASGASGAGGEPPSSK